MCGSARLLVQCCWQPWDWLLAMAMMVRNRFLRLRFLRLQHRQQQQQQQQQQQYRIRELPKCLWQLATVLVLGMRLRLMQLVLLLLLQPPPRRIPDLCPRCRARLLPRLSHKRRHHRRTKRSQFAHLVR